MSRHTDGTGREGKGKERRNRTERPEERGNGPCPQTSTGAATDHKVGLVYSELLNDHKLSCIAKIRDENECRRRRRDVE